VLDLDMRVLVVDDYSPMRRLLKSLLEQLGFKAVDEASDGGTALAKLRDAPIGLVVSDWSMEPMSGLDLLREVRADRELKHVPFLMVTAKGKTEHVVAAKEAGVSGYIVKPFNADTFKKKIETLFRKP
jgi:two-component system, chemotaxis family, chemotaxis protein CheY